MKQIDKPYERGFLLEPTKLTRLIDKIHERLGDHQNTTTNDSFEVFLSDKQHVKMTSVEQVLAIENSRKHKIQRLLIVCSAVTVGAIQPEHEIQVDFGKKKSASSNTKIIEVSVRSEVARWADRALSEVEEQVERTSLQDVPPRLALTFLVLSMSVFLLFLVMSSLMPEHSNFGDADVLWLRLRDIDRVEKILSQNRTITDEEMREIVTRQLRNVLEYQRPKRSPQKTLTRQRVLVGAPLVILFGCVIILFTCYPRAVFYWGDEVGRYDAIVQRRKTIWQIIIGVTIIGVVATFFSTSLISLLPPE
jgi:hypothetical protein